MRLSVFAGGWTLEAAEIVCDSEENEVSVLDLLTGLQEKSLVSVEMNSGLERRYRLLETSRQYAGERLNELGQASEAARRHRDWALDLAEAAEAHDHGPEANTWLARLAADHDNLRAALDSCENDHLEDGVEVGLRLAAALVGFWMDHGHYGEGQERLTRVLARAGERASETARNAALNALAALAWFQGDFSLTQHCTEEGLQLARRTGNQSHLAMCLSNLGSLHYSQGDNKAARTAYEQSLAMRRTIEDRAGVTACLNNLGVLVYNEGAWDEARALHTEALEIAQEDSDSYGEQGALGGLGNVMRQMGDFAAARSYFERELALAQKSGGKNVASDGSIDLGWLALTEGDWECAGTTLRQGLGLAQEAGLMPLALYALDGLAEQTLASGDARRAACLSGGAEAARVSLILPRMQAARKRCETHVAQMRDILGEEAFDDAWCTGGCWTLDQTIAFAIHGLPGQVLMLDQNPHKQ